jgi:hypothetical protein
MQSNAHFTAAGSVVIGFRGNWRDLKSRNQGSVMAAIGMFPGLPALLETFRVLD